MSKRRVKIQRPRHDRFVAEPGDMIVLDNNRGSNNRQRVKKERRGKKKRKRKKIDTSHYDAVMHSFRFEEGDSIMAAMLKGEDRVEWKHARVVSAKDKAYLVAQSKKDRVPFAVGRAMVRPVGQDNHNRVSRRVTINA